MQTFNHRKYPTTTALQCFEAAARHLSFTRAGRELHMTQSAVSKQVATLEELLGVSLFYRTSQGLQLSSVGQSYYLEVLAILKQLESATINLKTRSQAVEVLNIVSHPTFCAQWLIPNLQGFNELHPFIHINIKEQTEPLLDTSAADMAFLYGDGVWAHMNALKLFDEYCVAVCRPDYLPADIDVHDLSSYPLIWLSTRPSAWQQYFMEQGVSFDAPVAGIQLDTFYACISAAVSGYGVALIPLRFIEKELALGSLVTALPYRLQSVSAYYMMYQNHLEYTPKVQSLLSWIQHKLI